MYLFISTFFAVCMELSLAHEIPKIDRRLSDSVLNNFAIFIFSNFKLEFFNCKVFCLRLNHADIFEAVVGGSCLQKSLRLAGLDFEALSE